MCTCGEEYVDGGECSQSFTDLSYTHVKNHPRSMSEHEARINLARFMFGNLCHVLFAGVCSSIVVCYAQGDRATAASPCRRTLDFRLARPPCLILTCVLGRLDAGVYNLCALNGELMLAASPWSKAPAIRCRWFKAHLKLTVDSFLWSKVGKVVKKRCFKDLVEKEHIHDLPDCAP